MERVRVAPEYDAKWLEVERPQPLCDNYLESLFTDTATGFKGIKPDHSLAIHEQFKEKATKFIFGSTLNTLPGIDAFSFIGITAGVLSLLITFICKALYRSCVVIIDITKDWD